jgi:hypothetical protein
MIIGRVNSVVRWFASEFTLIEVKFVDCTWAGTILACINAPA